MGDERDDRRDDGVGDSTEPMEPIDRPQEQESPPVEEDATSLIPPTEPPAEPHIEPPVESPPPDATSVIPQDAAWQGRAGVPVPGSPNLRDSAPYAQPQQYEPEPPGRQRPWWTPVLLGIVALGLLGVVLIAAWLMTRDRGAEPAASPTPAPTQPATTRPVAPTTRPASPTPSPTPAMVRLPRLVGLTQQQATAELERIGLFYRFEYRQSTRPEGIVIETQPREGEVIPANTTVTLVVSTGPAPKPTPTFTPTPAASAQPGD